MVGSGLPVVVVDAPSNLGLRPPEEGREPGVRGLASALRGRGLVSRLGAEDGGRLTPPPYSPEVEPATGTRNGEAIRRLSMELAGRFAGPDPERAKYYPADEEFLLDFEPEVGHYEVVVEPPDEA